MAKERAIRNLPIKLSAAIVGIGLLVVPNLVLPPPTVPPAVQAASAPVTLTQVLSGFRQPLFVTHAGDGRNRLFVVEKGGTLQVAVDGQIQPTPFLDLSRVVRSSGSEQGLLGMAFHPQYAINGLFFVAYTALDGANTV